MAISNKRFNTFIDRIEENILKEKKQLEHHISHGNTKKLGGEWPYEYWVGQVLAYEAALEIIDTAIKRLNNPEFEGD